MEICFDLHNPWALYQGTTFSRALEFLSELNPQQMATQAPPSPLSSRANPDFLPRSTGHIRVCCFR
jgi:hypothetical protein